jgi:biotin carboxylase
MKKAIAKALSVLLVLVAPGFAPYQALAQVVRPEGAVEGGIPVEAAPLSLDANVASPSSLSSDGALGEAPALGQESISAAAASQPAQAARDGRAVSSLDRAALKLPNAASPDAKPTVLRGLSAAEEPKKGDAGSEKDVHGTLFDGRDAHSGALYVPENSYEGQTLLITGSLASRPWILGDAKRFADEHGMKLAVVDSKEQRANSIGLVPDDHFIEGNVDDHSAANEAAILDKVEAWAKGRSVALTQSFLNQYALLAAKIGERIGSKSDPVAGVEAAHDKALSGEALQKNAPHITGMTKKIDSAEQARASFAEVAGPGGMVVIKPVRGGGSEGVVVDVDSPEKAAQVWTQVDKFLRDFMKLPDAGHSNLDQYPGIVMMRQYVGPEIDAEFVTRKGPEGKPVVDFFMVSDNPPMDKPYAVEKGATFPSQLAPSIWGEIREAGLLALEAHGLSEGNAHIEFIVDPKGPMVLELNKRMGGLFVKPMVEVATGFNLVEGALRAYLDLRPKPYTHPDFTLEVRMALPPKTPGIIEKIEGLEHARGLPGVDRVVELMKAGDAIRSVDQDMFAYPLYLSATGATYEQAYARTQAALRAIKIHIRQADGSVAVISADAGHVKDDPTGLLEKVQRDQAARAAQAAGREAPKDEGKFTPSFYTFLGGVTLQAMMQESIAVMKPLYAALVGGLGFAVLTQAMEQAFRIPGSIFGAKFSKRFDARMLYVIANIVNGAAFIAIPLVFFAKPAWVLFAFLGYSALAGIAYGMTRGVAEQTMPPRILGQENERLLEKAGSAYFLWVEPAAFGAAFLVSALGIGAGNALTPLVHRAAMVAGGLLMLTAIPFAFVKYKQKDVAMAEGRHGSEDSLPLRLYVPYAFFQFMHQAFYSLLAWMVAGEVLHNKGLTGNLTGLYDLGSFGFVSLMMLAPTALKKLGVKLLPNWTEKQWTIAAAVPVALFVWGSLLLRTPAVSLAAAVLLGAATTVGNIKWKKTIQNRLKLEAQPRVFGNLMIAAVLGSLVPFVVIKGGMALNLGLSLSMLLNVVALGITGATAAMLWSLRNDKKKPS